MKIPLFTLLLALPLGSHAATDWVSAAISFTDDTVVPAYNRFVDTSAALHNSAKQYCSADQTATKEDLIAAYHLAADGWQGVQIYRAGPAQPFMRHNRVSTWPGVDKIIDKQLRALLSAKDSDALDAKRFASSSAAIQGFPALERLLFGGAKTPSPVEPGNYACELLISIANNLQTIGEDMREGWQHGHKEQILHAGQTDSYLTGPEDVAGELLTDFYMQIYSLADQKLGRPYSKSRFRYKRAESWRSQRSLRNVKINIDSAENYYRHLFMPAMQTTKLNKEILQLFLDAKLTGENLNDDFAIANENNPEKIKHWQSTLQKISDITQQKMPVALNITIGFNALDGDG